jgi:hypothetical protein
MFVKHSPTGGGLVAFEAGVIKEVTLVVRSKAKKHAGYVS